MPLRPEPALRRPEPIIRRLMVLALALGAVVWVSVLVWQVSARSGLAQLQTRAEADLRLAADRLTSAVVQFREVAVLAAEHPYVMDLARGEGAKTPEAVAAVLQRMADRAGAQDLMLLSPGGRVLAGPEGAPAFLPAAPDLVRAAQGATGAHHGVNPVTGRRFYRYAAPVFSSGGPVAGIVVLSFDVDRVEAPGRGDPVPVWFTDAGGVQFIANRSEMLLQVSPGGRPDPGSYPAGHLTPAPAPRKTMLAGQALMAGGGYLPDLALEVTKDLPVIGLTGHALGDAGAVLRTARAQALSVALALLGFGAVILALAERRRALADQLAAEARANAALEVRVAERTAELQAANDQLTRTQAELVQAGKLSALGQMSAGISHELNQPLMAIRSFAENAELLLERGQVQAAGQTLARISDMARRMGRIIKNLRAFARSESEPATRVGLAAVVEGALELMAGRMARAGVSVDWQRPTAPAIVMGGEVRLSQVTVNLLSNAIEAMEDLPAGAPRRITIRIAPGVPGHTRLSIRDTGPGIADPSRIFDPFYSTKEVGSEEGLGLGLSISYGLVQGFGGTLSGANAPDGGAIFTVDLRAAPEPARVKEGA